MSSNSEVCHFFAALNLRPNTNVSNNEDSNIYEAMQNLSIKTSDESCIKATGDHHDVCRDRTNSSLSIRMKPKKIDKTAVVAPTKKPLDKLKRYSCQICKKIFQQKKIYLIHCATHQQISSQV
ncbi:unnamed protein product [Orchesella dallaii]|uniref:C2H2-type domain-containing protein n=1 Tax=Orchesella dallaii TaxID=48710 RepID=A0ABP1PTK6_9HEXA